MGMKISQAGTLSGNPLAMVAGFEQLQVLSEDGTYDRLETVASILEEGMRDNIQKLGLPYPVNRVGGMLCMFFTEDL